MCVHIYIYIYTYITHVKLLHIRQASIVQSNIVPRSNADTAKCDMRLLFHFRFIHMFDACAATIGDIHTNSYFVAITHVLSHVIR